MQVLISRKKSGNEVRTLLRQYFEVSDPIDLAISGDKQIKGYSQKRIFHLLIIRYGKNCSLIKEFSNLVEIRIYSVELTYRTSNF